MTRKTLSAWALGFCGVLIGSPAIASITWDFTSGLTEGATNAGTFGNTRYETDGTVKVTASAWSNTTNVTVNNVTTYNALINTAYLGLYTGGLGVTNRDGTSTSSYNTSCPTNTSSSSVDNCEGTPGVTISPEHAVDNNQRYDAVLLHFDQAVNLSSVSIGYKDTDADITVLASNSAGLLGKSYSGATGLVAAGWSLVGNFADLTTSAAKSIANSLYKTDWLILAYNPDFGGTLSNGNDYFKISAVTGDKYKTPPPPGNAPEPGTAFLLGAAMLGGLWRTRRTTRNGGQR